MLWCPFWSIQVYFGAFWCTLRATPQPFQDLFWLLSRFKFPSNPEIDYIRNSGWIWNSFALSCCIEHFGPFWCILVQLMCNPMTPPWLHWLLSPFKCPSIPEKNYISQSGLIRNTFALSCYGDHFGPFWSILVHLMGDPSTPLHQIFRMSSKICVLCIKSFWTPPILPS